MSLKRHPRHYQTTLEIISAYDQSTPYPLFLSNTFRKHKNWGSKDRKAYRELSYLYWKNHHKFSNLDRDAQIAMLNALDTGKETPDQNPYASLSAHISSKIDKGNISTWFHPTPPVFFFPWDIKADFTAIGGIKNPEGSWGFENPVDLSSFIDSGKGIIQDISSTQVVQSYSDQLRGKKVWDCCAGSGGKALLISAHAKPEKLHCSDIRPQTIQNLISRFNINGLTQPFTSVLDLSKPNVPLREIDAEIAFADVPCSGSGTWRRNPENLAQFDSEKIKQYTQIQKTILGRIASKTNIKQIIYCTCSIFQEENELMIDEFVESNTEFRCISQRYHGETPQKFRGDFLFSALLERKPI